MTTSEGTLLPCWRAGRFREPGAGFRCIFCHDEWVSRVLVRSLSCRYPGVSRSGLTLAGSVPKLSYGREVSHRILILSLPLFPRMPGEQSRRRSFSSSAEEPEGRSERKPCFCGRIAGFGLFRRRSAPGTAPLRFQGGSSLSGAFACPRLSECGCTQLSDPHRAQPSFSSRIKSEHKSPI